MRIRDMKLGAKVRLSNLFRNSTIKWADADLDRVGIISQVFDPDIARITFDPPIVNGRGDVTGELILSKNYITRAES